MAEITTADLDQSDAQMMEVAVSWQGSDKTDMALKERFYAEMQRHDDLRTAYIAQEIAAGRRSDGISVGGDAAPGEGA